MARNREKWEAQIRAKRDEYLERIRPEVLRLAEELHGGVYAPNQSEYMQFASKPVDRTTVVKAFGPWGNVAAACGLPLADAKYYYHKAQERRGQAEKATKSVRYTAQDEELLAAHYKPPIKVRLEDKLRAEELCADIADEQERKRLWLSTLGYPTQFVEAWT
jgi:hypothetical protein